MKKFLTIVLAITLTTIASAQEDDTRPVNAGEPGKKPFWNQNAQRFIYAPAFNLPEVSGASKYLFTVKSSGNKSKQFTSGKPWAALSPVWKDVPEGYTTLTVEGTDAAGKVIGKSGERSFYRSPIFSGDAGKSVISYPEAGRIGLKAIYDAPHVQYWLTNKKPDPTYARYCYPSKIIGGLVRAMTAYSKVADNKKDRDNALQIAKFTADYLISIRLPANSYYSSIPLTYSAADVNKAVDNALDPIAKNWLMVPSSVDPALGFLDLYDVTKDTKYFEAAKAIAKTLLKTQDADGTWAYMANKMTGEPAVKQRLIPTWLIFFFDRLDKQYQVKDYRTTRERAWQWIVNNTLKTYQWDGQFEDIKPRSPYMNLAREQACDVATLLLSEPKKTPANIAQAEELLRFAEDQFVVWSPLTDPAGWRKAMPDRRKNYDKWITPNVLEQYACYDPVARSSAILINAYLKAHEVTKKPIYLTKAKALTNSLVTAQAWMNEEYKTNGEIPTWVMKTKPINWLNNSYYAADAVLTIGSHEQAAK